LTSHRALKIFQISLCESSKKSFTLFLQSSIYLACLQILHCSNFWMFCSD